MRPKAYVICYHHSYSMEKDCVQPKVFSDADKAIDWLKEKREDFVRDNPEETYTPVDEVHGEWRMGDHVWWLEEVVIDAEVTK